MSTDGRSGVLVLDADSQCGLSVIRSLGSMGVPVTAGSLRRRSLGRLSRYSADAYHHPDPGEDVEGFIRHLVDHLSRADYFGVIPVEDHTSALLARHKSRLERSDTVVAVEDRETFDRAFDKAKLFEVATRLDIPTPETHTPATAGEVREIADDIDYPVVVKSRSKSQLTDRGYTTCLVTEDDYVDSAADLPDTFRRVRRQSGGRAIGPPIVQEYVPGVTTTTVGLAEDGELLAYFQEERLRTYPSSGGNSALLAAVADETMLEYSQRLLRRLGWTGPVMVEFMRTPAGEFKLIEVNGRYWGSVPFAIACGVDVPRLHYLQLRGSDPASGVDFGEYRLDVVQRRLLYEDIKWIDERLVDGDLAALGPFLASFVSARHTFVRVDDPVPTVGALLQAAGLAAGSAVRRLRERWVSPTGGWGRSHRSPP